MSMNNPTAGKDTKKAGAAPTSQPGFNPLDKLSDQNKELLKNSGLSQAELDALNKSIDDKTTQGFEDRTSDLEGYWVSEAAPIHCRPEHVKLFDGQINKGKPSALVTVFLLSPTVCSRSSDEDPDKKDLKIIPAGKKVGIWMKPGMRDLANCAGAETVIRLTGTKKVHKEKGMNPMKVYSVKSKGEVRKLSVEEDRRQESASVKTIFDVKRAPAAPPAGTDPESDVADDGMPF